MTLDATDIETDAAVIDHESGTADRIRVGVTGTYLVLYDIDSNAPGSSSETYEIIGRVRRNDIGSGINGSQAEATVFNDSSIGGDLMTNHLSHCFIANLTANDYITLQIQAVAVEAGSAPSTRASGVSLKVVRLN